MLCFSHKGNVAVGLCQVCGKGTCQNCFTLVRDRLCCESLACKEATKLHLELLDISHKLYYLGKYKNKRLISPISLFYICLGSLFIGFDLWNHWIHGNINNILFSLIWAIFLIFALYYSLKISIRR